MACMICVSEKYQNVSAIVVQKFKEILYLTQRFVECPQTVDFHFFIPKEKRSCYQTTQQLQSLEKQSARLQLDVE